MVHSHNSGSAVWIVLLFCTMKGAKRDMGIINGFSEKYLMQGNLVILAQNWYIRPHNFGSALRVFFNFAQ